MQPEHVQRAQQTVGAIVTEDYRRAAVLKRYDIDFCCGGGKTLEAACKKRGVALDDVIQALSQADDRNSSAAPARASDWSPDFLADYIINVHHAYVRESLPVLRAFTWKVARVHGDANPETVEIARLFVELAAELEGHLEDEETTLFPYIRELVVTGKEGRAPERPAFGSVGACIDELEREHEHAGALLQEIRRLSRDFTPPAHACATFRATYAKLEEFEDDLHLHVHLENNVLFPQAADLEPGQAV